MGLIHYLCILLVTLFSYNIVEHTLHLQIGFQAADQLSATDNLIPWVDSAPDQGLEKVRENSVEGEAPVLEVERDVGATLSIADICSIEDIRSIEQTYNISIDLRVVDQISTIEILTPLTDKIPDQGLEQIQEISIEEELSEQEVATASSSTENGITEYIRKDFITQIKMQFAVIWLKIKCIFAEFVHSFQKIWIGEEDVVKVMIEEAPWDNFVQQIKFMLNYTWALMRDFYNEYLHDYIQVVLEMKWSENGDKDKKIPKKDTKKPKQKRIHPPGKWRIIKGKYYDYIENLEKMREFEEMVGKEMEKLWVANRGWILFYILPAACLVALLFAGLYYTMPETLARQADEVQMMIQEVHRYFTAKERRRLNQRAKNRLRRRLHLRY